MVLDSGAMPYSELQFNYNGLISVYRETGDDTKRKEFEEKKKKEWEVMQIEMQLKLQLQMQGGCGCKETGEETDEEE